SFARSRELRSETAPEEPAATGERSRTETGSTCFNSRRHGRLWAGHPRLFSEAIQDNAWTPGTRPGMTQTSERPRPAQLPILFPPGQMTFSELQRNHRVRWIKSRHASRPIGEIDFGTLVSGVIDKLRAQSEGGFIRRHAEGERKRVGLISAIGCQAHAERENNALHRTHGPPRQRFGPSRGLTPNGWHS